jgi:cardiolipin synthase
LLGLLAGCHLPPPRVVETDPDHPRCSRTLLLGRQVFADSAVELAHHPLRCGKNLIVETGEHFAAVGAGAFTKRCCMSFHGCPGPLEPSTTEDVLDSMPPGPPDHDSRPGHFELYPDPALALHALRNVIDQATGHIDVMMFLWENDEVGNTVAQWLTEKAACGIHVRVLVDGGGNLIFSPFHKGIDVNGAVCALAHQPNVEVVRIRDPFCRFDHRKLVLVDGRLSWTGGRNFTHKSFFGQNDLSFTVVGPLVDDLQASFEEEWKEQVCSSEQPHTEEATAPAPCWPCEAPANAWGKLVHTGPCGHHLATPLYEAVDHARHYVYLENGYLSDPQLVCKLAAARRRGVDVRVVMTLSSHETIVDCANRVTANRLFRAGVRVYIYPQMTHAKAGLIDGCWAYLGTGNYDALSLRHNCEFGVILSGPLVAELDEHLFQQDFCPDWEMKQPLKATVADYLGEVVMCLCL